MDPPIQFWEKISPKTRSIIWYFRILRADLTALRDSRRFSRSFRWFTPWNWKKKKPTKVANIQTRVGTRHENSFAYNRRRRGYYNKLVPRILNDKIGPRAVATTFTPPLRQSDFLDAEKNFGFVLWVNTRTPSPTVFFPIGRGWSLIIGCESSSK